MFFFNFFSKGKQTVVMPVDYLMSRLSYKEASTFALPLIQLLQYGLTKEIGTNTGPVQFDREISGCLLSQGVFSDKELKQLYIYMQQHLLEVCLLNV